jgi:hypothetical protein
MSKKINFIITPIKIVVVIGVLLVSLLTYKSYTNQDSQVVFFDPSSSLTLSYSPNLMPTALSSGDLRDKFLLRLQPEDSSGENLLISVRYENGFEKISNVTLKDPIDIILDSIERSYPQRFQGFTKINQAVFNLNGSKAAEINFEYLGPTEETITQVLLVLMKDSDRAFYVSFQSPKEQFENIYNRYYPEIKNSVRFNFDSSRMNL